MPKATPGSLFALLCLFKYRKQFKGECLAFVKGIFTLYRDELNKKVEHSGAPGGGKHAITKFRRSVYMIVLISDRQYCGGFKI